MKSEQSSDKAMPSPMALIMSFVTHALLLAPVIYILSVAFDNYEFFSWHPVLMSLGAALIIVEGVFAISGEPLVSKYANRSSRIRIHWIMHLVGVVLLAIGLAIIIVNKNNKGKSHFATTHGQLGLSTFVITCAVASFGILANNARVLYPRVRPLLVKVFHAFGGIAVTILLLATVINGTYSKWWTHVEASETGRSLVFASLFIAGVFVLVKPVIGAIARSRVLAKPPTQRNVQVARNST